MRKKPLFLLFLIILSIITVIFIPNVYAITYIFSDGFEDGTRDKWIDEGLGQLNVAQAVTVWEGSYALEIKKVLPDYPNSRIYATFANQTNKVLLFQIGIRIAFDSGYHKSISLSNSTMDLSNAYRIFFTGGASDYIAWNDGSMHNIMNFGLDTWYNITLKIYQASQTYKIWINTILRESNALPVGSPTNIDRIVLWNHNSGINEKMYVDSVLLWEGSGVDIENIEIMDREQSDREDWIFSQKTYIFNATVRYETGYIPYLVTVGFQDFNDNWLNATVDLANKTYSYTADNDIGYLAKYENTTNGNLHYIIFHIYLSKEIIDTENIDLWGFASATTGLPFTFRVVEVNYCNIYRQGGLSEYETTGTAFRLDGGQLLEIYAFDGGLIRVNQTFKHLQHVHLLVSLDPRYNNTWDNDNPNDDRYNYDNSGMFWEFGIDYLYNETWIEGFKLRIELIDANIQSILWNNYNEMKWNITWWNNGILIKQDEIWSFWEEENVEYPSGMVIESYSRLFIDLWFSKENSTRVIEGIINSYYFAYWWTDLDKHITSSSVISLFADTLRDNNGNTISATDLTLMNFWAKVNNDGVADGSTFNRIAKTEAINYIANKRVMEGVDEPILTQTKKPTVHQWGFLTPLFQAFGAIGKVIGDAFQWIMIEAIKGLSAVGNTVFSWLGLGDTAFTDIMNTVGRFVDATILSLTTFITVDIGTLILNVITAISLVLSGLIGIITVLFTSFVKIIPVPFQLVGGFLTYMGDFWDGTGMFTGFAFKDFSTIMALALTFYVVTDCVRTGSIRPLMGIIGIMMTLVKTIYWIFNLIIHFMLFLFDFLRKLKFW